MSETTPTTWPRLPGIVEDVGGPVMPGTADESPDDVNSRPGSFACAWCRRTGELETGRWTGIGMPTGILWACGPCLATAFADQDRLWCARTTRTARDGHG